VEKRRPSLSNVLAPRNCFRSIVFVHLFPAHNSFGNKRSLALNPFIIEHVCICVISIVVTPRLDK
jgi:hypothetical protein